MTAPLLGTVEPILTEHERMIANAEGCGYIVGYWLPRLWAFPPSYMDKTVEVCAREAARFAFKAFPELRG